MKAVILTLVLIGSFSFAKASSLTRFDCGDVFWGFTITTDGQSAEGYIQSGYSGIRLKECTISNSEIICKGYSKEIGREDFHQISVSFDGDVTSGAWLSSGKNSTSGSLHPFNSCKVFPVNRW